MQVIQLLLALSFLVVIHELGHFTFARIFGVRVEKFYMFFNPKFSLVRLKRINGRWQVKFFAPNVESALVDVIDSATGEPKLDKHGKPVQRPMTDDELAALPQDDWRRYPDSTEWGIGWVPFGGYCAIAGMIDETKSATNLATTPQPWEFRSKKAWQRMCIIIGGILVNFIGAMIMYMGILHHWGTDEMPLSNISTGLYYSPILLEEGFQQQDHILSIDSTAPNSLSDITQQLIIEGKRNVLVQRGMDTITLVMSPDLGTRYLAYSNTMAREEQRKKRADASYQKKSYPLVSYFMPFVIDSLLEGGAAWYAGMAAGDSIVGVNELNNLCYEQVIAELKQHPCDSVRLTFYRDGECQQAALFIGDQSIIGVYPRMPWSFYQTIHHSYSWKRSITSGLQYGWEVLTMYIKQFKLVFTKEGAQSLGGFGTIGSLFPSKWSWYGFWSITAFLSLILAFMNFLPIPALDGGYILFLLFEMITGKQPGDKFLEKANMVGFWLLILLLIYANLNDIIRFFF